MILTFSHDLIVNLMVLVIEILFRRLIFM